MGVKMRVLRLLCLVLLLIFGHSDLIKAQVVIKTTGSQCQPPCHMQDRPPCEIAWAPYVSAVFVGSVIELKEESIPVIQDGKHNTTWKQTATVKIEEAFWGVESKVVTVVSEGRLCGFNFYGKKARYLFYATRQTDGAYSVSMTGATELEIHAVDHLKYLRALPTMPETSTVYGRVSRYTEPNRDDIKHFLRICRAAMGEKVIIKGESQTFAAIVEKDGTFRVTGLPPGTYKVSIQVDAPTLVRRCIGGGWQEMVSSEQEIIVHAKGCAEVNFLIDPFMRL